MDQSVTPGGPTPGWRITLRFEDAPSVLDAEEAAVLARMGTTGHPIYELIKAQDIQTRSGNPPANPLKHIRHGKRILIPRDALLQWLMKEAGA